MGKLIKLRSKILGAAVALIVVAGAGYLGWSDTSTGSQSVALPKGAEKAPTRLNATKAVAEIERTNSSVAGEPAAAELAAQPAVPISEEEFEAIQREQAGMPPVDILIRGKEYSKQKGYYGEEDLSEYLAYSTETLMELSDAGDLKALEVLGDRYFQSGEYEKQFETWKKAAVHGATSVLMGIGGSHIAGADNTELASDEARKKVIEGLAWYQMGLKRGDGYYNAYLNNTIKNNNIQLDHETERQVMQRAQEIYEELENERRKLGLGEFDNSVPPELEAYYQWHTERAAL